MGKKVGCFKAPLGSLGLKYRTTFKKYFGQIMWIEKKIFNKTRTPQVGAISKAQKAQNIFLEKNLKFSKKNSFGKCRTVPKNVKGGPFLNYKHAFCSKITKNSKEDPLGTLKKFEKKSHSAEKKSKGGGGTKL